MLLAPMCLLMLMMYLVTEVLAGGSGSCPEVRQVHSCSPKCEQSYECTGGKVCCENQCHRKSCVEPAKYGSGGGGDKYQSSSGAGIYCNNVKCNAFEVCKQDKASNRMRCQRA